MVLDVDQLRKSVGQPESAPKGLLWVLEQIPGITQSADVSKQLLEQGFWASYNVP